MGTLYFLRLGLAAAGQDVANLQLYEHECPDLHRYILPESRKDALRHKGAIGTNLKQRFEMT